MPIFNSTLLTERGLEAANKAANGQFSFTIVKAVASQRDYRNKNDNELRQLTSLDNEVEGKILDQNNADSKVTGIKTSYNNEIATGGYTANTVGLYAKDSNGDTFLYSVTTAQVGQVIPAIENDKIFSGFELTIFVIVGNVQNMKVELTPGGDATIDYVNKAVSVAFNAIKNDLQGFKVREITDEDDFWGLKPGIYICQGETPKHNPYNARLWGVAISFGKTIQYFNKDGEEWIITPDNGGWERLAKRGYVDSAVNSVADTLSSQVNGFNSVIAVNQSSAVANASNAWAQINYNGSDISNLKSQTASNATRAYNIENRTSAAESNISTVKSQTASNATRIFNAENRLNSAETKVGQLSQYRTTYSGNILDMYSLADGLYWLTGDNYNGPLEKMWANALVSHINPYDTMIVIIAGTDIYTNMTSNNSWIGWNKLANNKDVVNLTNQVNGVLARQSLILNQGIPVPFNGNLNPNARYYYNEHVIKLSESFTVNNYQSVTIDVSRLGVSFSNVSTNIASSAASMFTVGISNNIVTITLSNPHANTVSQTFNNMEIYLN